MCTSGLTLSTGMSRSRLFMGKLLFSGFLEEGFHHPPGAKARNQSRNLLLPHTSCGFGLWPSSISGVCPCWLHSSRHAPFDPHRQLLPPLPHSPPLSDPASPSPWHCAEQSGPALSEQSQAPRAQGSLFLVSHLDPPDLCLVPAPPSASASSAELRWGLLHRPPP